MFGRRKRVWVPHVDMLGGKKNFRRFQKLCMSYGICPPRERFPVKEIDVEISNLEKLAGVAQLPYVPDILRQNLPAWCDSIKRYLLCAAATSAAGDDVDKRSIQKVVKPSWKAKCRQAAELGKGLQGRITKRRQP